MLDVIKKFDSATIKALFVATIPLVVFLASLLGFDPAKIQEDANKYLEIVLTVIALGAVTYAAWARLFKPTPPLTETAAAKTAELVAEGKLKTVPTPQTKV